MVINKSKAVLQLVRCGSRVLSQTLNLAANDTLKLAMTMSLPDTSSPVLGNPAGPRLAASGA